MIIGLTGTNGAGKGTIVGYLQQKGFKHYSSRAFLIEEIEKHGLPIDRSSMREVANELRKKYGPAYIVETLYAEALRAGGDAVIESIRALKEVELLKSKGALLVSVDTTDRQVRYGRAMKRASETDKIDFDTWVMQEEREWHNTADHDMNVLGVMEKADFSIQNNGTLDELRAQVNAILERIKK